MSSNDSFSVPMGEARSEIVIKRSKFIASIKPLETADEAMAFVTRISKEFYDATHNCWAYNLKDGGSRRSDDGEPAGTAGQPILNVLTGNGVFNAACVVTRYFGGTLLGAGGLIRAYSEAAGEAIKKAGLGVMLPAQKISVSAPYNLYGPIIKLISEAGAFGAPESVFSEEVRITFFIEPEKTADFEKSIRELSSGRVKPEYLRKDYLLKRVL